MEKPLRASRHIYIKIFVPLLYLLLLREPSHELGIVAVTALFYTNEYHAAQNDNVWHMNRGSSAEIELHANHYHR